MIMTVLKSIIIRFTNKPWDYGFKYCHNPTVCKPWDYDSTEIHNPTVYYFHNATVCIHIMEKLSDS